MDRIEEIRRLHATWERLTGQRLVLDAMRERAWFDWLERGLTESDLALLVRDLQGKIRAGKCSPAGLKFRYVVANVDQAEEDVAELKARRRRAAGPSPGKAAVLRATGREAENPPAAAAQAGDVMRRSAELEQARRALRAWLEANR